MISTKTSPQPLRYSLGIDAGCASIGWCVVELDKKNQPIDITSAGVRRFEAGVEGDITRGRDESKSQQRREARGPRRNTWRRQWRMRKVFHLLQQADLLPPCKDDSHYVRHHLFLELDIQLIHELELITDRTSAHVVPYTLRARALDNPLPAYALGRALYHLAQRRGFLSNLKAGRGDDEDRGKVKTGISELATEMDHAEARTLGEYFAKLDPEDQRIRQRWTSRQMYRDEFEAIWLAQAAHHPQLTEKLREKLSAAIFDQRPLKSQKGLVGRCELEPYKRRGATACLPYQLFRVLQRVNDLKVLCPDGELRVLDKKEKSTLIAELSFQGDLSWARVKTLLGMKKSKTYGRHFEFNFEEDGDKKMIGNRTASKFASSLGDDWHALDQTAQTALVDSVLSFEDEQSLIKHLQQHWELSGQQAQAIAALSLEAGYGNISRRAINKLRPFMEEGIAFSTARKEVYPESFESNDPVDYLPPFHEVAPSVRNPTLTRVMAELRKVVNALIKKHGGKPAFVRIELARDLKRSRKDRKQLTEQRDQNTKARENALRNILKKCGREFDKPHNILKYRLAEECNWICPFTGKGFGMDEIISAEPQLDVEHIIPYSRSLDNSYANKTLCFNDENRHVKKNGTPFEAYGSTGKWDEIIERVRHFQGKTAKRKLQLFQIEKLDDFEDFANRQLSDTRYLSRSAANYIAVLYGGRTDEYGKLRVQVSPGRLTAILRRAWDLNRLGIGDPDDPNQKDRSDHRHHAIDAFVIAVTNPTTVKAANDAASRAEDYYSRELLTDMALPWKGFSWKDLGDMLDRIYVSSRVNRKLNGKLHQDTILSKPYTVPDPKNSEKTKTVHHVRKPLAKMSRGEVQAIVDPAIKKTVLDKLEKIGGEPAKAFADSNNHPYLTAKDGRLIPIHSARIRKSDKTIDVGQGSRLRRVCPGDNHHMEIVAVLDKDGNHKKWEGHIVSQFEAMQRFIEARRDEKKLEIICKLHGKGREFVFSVATGEHLEFEYEGAIVVWRVTTISGERVELVRHHDARPAKIDKKRVSGRAYSPTVNTLLKLKAHKIVIDPLGRTHTAND